MMSGSCALAAKCIEQHKSRSFLDVRPTGTKVYAPPFYVDTWSLAPNTSFSFTDFLSIQGQTKVELDAHGMPEASRYPPRCTSSPLDTTRFEHLQARC